MAYPKTICPCCLKKVLDTEKGIQCDKECGRWFHIKCVDLPEVEYNKYANNTKKIWQCSRADCKSDSNDPFSALSAQLNVMLDKMSNLATKDEIKTVTDGIALVNSSLTNINKKLEELEPRLKATEDRLDIIEERLDRLQAGPTSSGPESVIEELNDRSNRARNVLLFNITENKSNDVSVRVKHDNVIAGKLIAIVLPNQTIKFKTIRVGKPNRDKHRPLKVIFNDDTDARNFITHFAEEEVKKLDDIFANISISRDRTVQERQYLKNLRSELDRRIKGGEKGLTIRYRNGIPVIVQNQKN